MKSKNHPLPRFSSHRGESLSSWKSPPQKKKKKNNPWELPLAPGQFLGATKQNQKARQGQPGRGQPRGSGAGAAWKPSRSEGGGSREPATNFHGSGEKFAGRQTKELSLSPGPAAVLGDTRTLQGWGWGRPGPSGHLCAPPPPPRGAPPSLEEAGGPRGTPLPPSRSLALTPANDSAPRGRWIRGARGGGAAPRAPISARLGAGGGAVTS